MLPRVQSLLDMMGETGEWSPIWTGIYKANALTLDNYRHGRVLLAGDAAHLLPIFDMRGANSAIDDADNLAWKLALVLRGLAAPALLDSYSHERVAAAHENLSHGTKSTEFMAPPSFAFELMRTAVLGLAARHAGLRSLINPRQTSAIEYRDSPLNAWPGRSAAFAAGPAPGAVLPECPLTLAGGRAGHLTDLLKPAFVALYFGGQVPAELQTWVQRWRAQGLPVVARCIAAAAGPTADVWDPTGRLVPLLGAESGALLLLRPDGHVLARWRVVPMATVPVEADAALSQLLQPGGV